MMMTMSTYNGFTKRAMPLPMSVGPLSLMEAINDRDLAHNPGRSPERRALQYGELMQKQDRARRLLNAADKSFGEADQTLAELERVVARAARTAAERPEFLERMDARRRRAENPEFTFEMPDPRTAADRVLSSPNVNNSRLAAGTSIGALTGLLGGMGVDVWRGREDDEEEEPRYGGTLAGLLGGAGLGAAYGHYLNKSSSVAPGFTRTFWTNPA